MKPLSTFKTLLIAGWIFLGIISFRSEDYTYAFMCITLIASLIYINELEQ